MFIGLLYVILLLLLIAAFFEDENMREYRWIIIAFGLLFTLCAAFRPEGIDKDYLSYLGYYYDPTSGMASLTEPSFMIICSIARFFGEPTMIFVIYALLAVPLKTYAITRITPFWFMSLLIWFTHLYMIQDMTQIRVAVAAAIYLFAIPFLADGKKLIFAGCVLFAIFFHYSALFLMPLCLFGNKPLTITWKIVLAVLPMIFYAFPVFSIDLLYLIPIPFIQDKIVVYEEIRDFGGMWAELNIYNIMAIARLLTYYMLLWKYDFVGQKCDFLALLLKIFCYSICVYAGMSFLPVISVRVQELVGVIDFVAIPLLAMTVRPHWLGRTAVLIYAVGIFLADLYLYEYLKT